MTAKVDGRRARGEARRRELIDAALVVLGREGLAGLTHRAIAQEAGVPLASASYHFAGIDDLIAVAMRRGIEDLARSLAAVPPGGGLGQLADLLAAELNGNRQLLLAEYEAYLYLARRPHQRPDSLLAWLDVLCDTFASELDAAQRRSFQATIEGACLHALFGDAPADPRQIEDTLRLAWPGATPPR